MPAQGTLEHSKRRCALVGAVDFNAQHFLNQHFDYVIAVDRGFAQLQEIGATPDCVVGDFDSLGFVPEERDVRVFPSEKDESDMELACRIACEQADELLLYGCLAQRLDHTLANLQLMSGLAAEDVHIVGIGDSFAVTAIHGGNAAHTSDREPEPTRRLLFNAAPLSAFTGDYGPYISVFPFGGVAEGVTIEGLKYEISNVTLPAAGTLGLSNEFTGRPACVEVANGTLLITFPLEAWSYLQNT